MSSGAGATLQNYNSELVRSIEDLREKREELNRQIDSDEHEKAGIVKEVTTLTNRLSLVSKGDRPQRVAATGTPAVAAVRVGPTVALGARPTIDNHAAGRAGRGQRRRLDHVQHLGTGLPRRRAE